MSQPLKLAALGIRFHSSKLCLYNFINMPWDRLVKFICLWETSRLGRKLHTVVIMGHFTKCFKLTIICPCRCFIVWSSRMWKDHDRQGNSQSLRLQVYQPSGLHADRHVVRRITEAHCRCLLIGCQNPAMHHLHRWDRWVDLTGHLSRVKN